MVRVKRFHAGRVPCAVSCSNEQQYVLLACSVQMLDPVQQRLRDLRRVLEVLVLESFPVLTCLRSRVTMLLKL